MPSIKTTVLLKCLLWFANIPIAVRITANIPPTTRSVGACHDVDDLMAHRIEAGDCTWARSARVN
jgi:hypothetical protein